MKNRTKLLIMGICAAALAAGIYFAAPFLLRIIGYIISLFAPFILGYIFSWLINPLANVLQKKLKIPRGFSAVLVMILTIGIIGGALVGVIWKLVDEIRNLYSSFPEMYVSWQASWHNFSNNLSHIYNALPSEIQVSLDSFTQNIGNRVSAFISSNSTPMVDSASNFAKAVPGALIAVVVFLLSVYFMVVDHKSVSAVIHKICGPRLSEKLNMVRKECGKYLGGYLKAQGILMIIVFIVIAIGMSILRAQYTLIVAFLTAFLDALPFFGSGITLWPLAAIYFISGNTKLGVGMIIIYIVIVLVRRFVEPKLVSDKLGLHPILTLMSMYIGYKLWSLLGMIFGPIILILFIGLYRAGIFNGLINNIKRLVSFIRRQIKELRDYILKIVEHR